MTRRLPSLNALRAFEAAGRHGRMSLAAKELNVTHSAVSRQVQQLEDVLRVSLFEGPKNAIRLTEEGRALLPGLTAGFDRLQAAIDQLSERENTELAVATGGTFAMRWLIPRLHAFQAAHPDLEVRLTSCDSIEQFARGRFDIRVRVCEPPPPPDSDARALFPEMIGPVLAPSLARLVARDIGGLPALHTHTAPLAWSRWLQRALPDSTHLNAMAEPSAGARYEHFYFMLEAALAGLGVAIGPWPLVADDVRAGRLLAPYGFVDSGKSYMALTAQAKAAKVTRFVDWLIEEAARFPAPEDGSAPVA
ncbi:LysR substrate-binding domain-containing protein [Afifella sp. JA880]|uniref:LysR substrate-binding domain-containing protein n=1 Tax=Afifella sp. JA880 TaxID=2975280 RepID=UPI0021BAAE9B|nr:LysR substrate-binding domain-containing protein [Afifella sp. JA880]MCT8268673.1 LysR substrate-binding domain-containing protein [Afifella sp. JA880]